MTLLLFACAPQGADLVPACAAYLPAQPDTWAHCVARAAPGLRSVAEMERVCTHADRWEEACRSGWVLARVNGAQPVSDDTLAACGSFDTCRFDALDAAPDPEIRTQLHRCHTQAGKFGRDCAGHALQRWMATQPDDAAIAALSADIGGDADLLGAVLGVRVSCGHLGACDASGPIGTVCQRVVWETRQQGACTGKWPMQPP